VQLPPGSLHELLPGLIQLAVFAQLDRPAIGVGAEAGALEATRLDLAGRCYALLYSVGGLT
jgi:hypothetical protein